VFILKDFKCFVLEVRILKGLRVCFAEVRILKEIGEKRLQIESLELKEEKLDEEQLAL
jgi:hypothetical protein